MIIVTGTKRSGTSMWMQILSAAGLPLFGEAFPRNWEQTLHDANPGGFYESILRGGIYWRTNPHPRTGLYFFPEQVEHHAVKVFIPGLRRTDRAFIGRVIATIRPWREYARSLRRLWAMEEAARVERQPRPPRPLPRLSPPLEWWAENYTLLRDVATRRYPVHLQSYDGLLDDPEGVLQRTFAWLGVGDAEAARAAVEPGRRTQRGDDRTLASGASGEGGEDPEAELEARDASLDPEIVAVFDRLYATVHAGEPIGAELLGVLNSTHQVLGPRIAEQQQAIERATRRRRAQSREQRAEAERLDDEEEQPTW